MSPFTLEELEAEKARRAGGSQFSKEELLAEKARRQGELSPLETSLQRSQVKVREHAQARKKELIEKGPPVAIPPEPKTEGIADIYGRWATDVLGAKIIGPLISTARGLGRLPFQAGEALTLPLLTPEQLHGDLPGPPTHEFFKAGAEALGPDPALSKGAAAEQFLEERFQSTLGEIKQESPAFAKGVDIAGGVLSAGIRALGLKALTGARVIPGAAAARVTGKAAKVGAILTNATRIALGSFASNPSEITDRFGGAGKSFLYAATPALSGFVPSRVGARAIDTFQNLILDEVFNSVQWKEHSEKFGESQFEQTDFWVQSAMSVWYSLLTEPHSYDAMRVRVVDDVIKKVGGDLTGVQREQLRTELGDHFDQARQATLQDDADRLERTYQSTLWGPESEPSRVEDVVPESSPRTIAATDQNLARQPSPPQSKSAWMVYESKFMDAIGKKFKEKWNDWVPERVKSHIRGWTVQEFRQDKQTVAAYNELQVGRRKDAQDITALIQSGIGDKATAEEMAMFDRVVSTEMSKDSLPPHLQAPAQEAHERANALANRMGAMAKAMGLPVRDEWLDDPDKHWWPRLYKEYEAPESIGGKLFYKARRRFGLTRLEGKSITKARVTDKFSVRKGKKTIGVFDTRGEAEVLAVKERRKSPRTRVDILDPMTREQLAASDTLDLIENFPFNARVGFGRKSSALLKTQFLTRMGELGPELVSPEEKPGFVKNPLTAQGMSIPQGALKKNPALDNFFKGFIRRDLARDLSAVYGKDGALMKLVTMYGLEPKLKGMVTYLDPERLGIKQRLENEFLLGIVDSGAFLSGSRIATYEKTRNSLRFNKTPTDPLWEPFMTGYNFAEESYVYNVGRRAEFESVSTPRVPDQMPKILERTLGVLGKAHDYARNQYGYTDLAHKFSLWKYYIEKQGLTPDESAEKVENYTMNFKDVPAHWYNWSRVTPFTPKVTYNFLRIFGKKMVESPTKFALKLGMLGVGWSFMRDFMLERADITEDDMKKMGKMAPKKWEIALPWRRGKGGERVSLDLTWLVPLMHAAKYVPLSEEESSDPQAILSLLPMTWRSTIAAKIGRDVWGRPLFKKTDSAPQRKWKKRSQMIGGFFPKFYGQTWYKLFVTEKRKSPEARRPWWDIVSSLIRTRDIERLKDMNEGMLIGARRELDKARRGLEFATITDKEYERRQKLLDGREAEIDAMGEEMESAGTK